MKTMLFIILVAVGITAQAQSIVGKWQLSDQKTCFQTSVKDEMKDELKETDTEKELEGEMGGPSSTADAARVLTLDAKGNAEEGVMSVGKKKASSKDTYKYRVAGSEFQKVDKKSGLVTERWVIDELSETTLKIHDSAHDCETKTYAKIK
jgi:hypothetical protein